MCPIYNLNLNKNHNHGRNHDRNRNNNSGRKILFQLSGSIATYQACKVISRLVQMGHEVQIVTTPSVFEFVGLATLEGLTHRSVAQHIFAPGEMMSHIEWARWADLFVLCPATASTLNRLAYGSGDDLLSCIFLAQDFTRPYLIFPAMNTHMLNHPCTQESLGRLKKMGVHVFDTQSGTLACGEIGLGKLLDPEEILNLLDPYLQSQTTSFPKDISAQDRPHRILITAGGTIEPLDAVRVITNRSTGRTGYQIAWGLALKGYEVVLLTSQNRGVENQLQEELIGNGLLITDAFTSTHDLTNKIKHWLSQTEFHAIVHSAAVSDFTVAQIQDSEGQFLRKEDFQGVSEQKISSQNDLIVKLKRNPKILPHLKEWSFHSKIKVIGFKLTVGASATEQEKAVQELFRTSPDIDYILCNDLKEITPNKHPFSLYQRESDCSIFKKGSSHADMIEYLHFIFNSGGVI